MCQYDTDALTQGYPHPHAGILPLAPGAWPWGNGTIH